MPELKLSLPERALLLILMATNSELSNPEIEKDYAPGLKLTGKNRLKLVDAGLIECRKGAGGAYFFRLDEEGWSYCREALANKSKDGGSAGKALNAILGGLDSYLERTGRSLAQIFGNLPERALTPSTLPADEIDLEVRRTYRKLADPAGSWVDLADIREHLVGIPRADVDAVLRLMARMPGIRIEEETNQKALTQRHREAAVMIGNRDQHVLSIESA